MIVANGKGRVSTLAVDDDLDMNGRAVTGALSMSVTDHVTLVGAQRFPGKGFRSNERNGWGVSKDNGDIERKFFKDDFSVVSNDRYSIAGNITGWGTGKLSLNSIDAWIRRPTGGPYGKYTIIGQFMVDSPDSTFQKMTIGSTGEINVYIRRSSTVLTVGLWDDISVTPIIGDINSGVSRDEIYVLSADVTPDGVQLSVNGVAKGSRTSLGGRVASTIGCRNDAAGSKSYCYGLSYSPSESYVDNFLTDTVTGANGRYQAVTGTVAYDDANKRMNVTTATGANGKASGRLKSYKFREGSQIYDVLLPTGADGDFICLATHSADGLMTDGIGVGLQSDGAGNWNLATLSGTTVTEGADSGLDDADVARIEIEKDITGAYWYYIYDAAGAKPTTATGKRFTTLTEGYTGWYANGAGATTQTYAIDNISIRAESIVGRTNVEEEEVFWFRDDFGENSIGRYITSGTITHDATDGEYDISIVANGYYRLVRPNIVGEGNYTAVFRFTEWHNTSVGIAGILIGLDSSTSINNGYYVKFNRTATNGKIVVQKFTSGGIAIVAEGTDYLDAITNTDEIKISVDFTGGVITATAYLNDVSISTVTYTDSSPYSEGCFGVMPCPGIAVSTPGVVSVSLLEFSGTRVYQKPIHRGAMLESYHDGTQEVVGTTFIDDCQWDRSAEYTVASGTTLTHVPASGYYTLNGNTGSFRTATSKQGIVGEGWYRFGLATKSDGWGIVNLLGGYRIAVRVGSTIYFATASGDVNYITGGASTTAPDTFFIVDLLYVGTTVTLYLNGTLVGTATNEIFSNLSGAVEMRGYNETNTVAAMFNLVQVIAISADATNGIAACIPPIGGGARYGVEEEVYHTYTNEVRKGKYLVSTCVKTTNADAEAIEMYLENTTDSTAITEDASKTVAIALTDTNYMDVEKEMKLGYADRGDTLKVAVRHTSAATEVSPACFVEMLNVTPTIEVI